MTNEARRKAILDRLMGAEQPIPAAVLAGELSVSRQIIVGDVALLRAAGEDITATARGYVMGRRDGERHIVACRHTPGEMGRELQMMVDYGCTVEDVSVEHSLYGQLSGRLDISSRYDVEQFLERVKTADAKPLSDLTGGIHLHTLRCPDEAAFQRLLDALKEAGFLVE
ncbi:MAG: transcription repressor NadR [Oscillospiraceae bacterium]|nr:transcription repressor NadR [Oscillospiraceae bacterium]